MNRRLTQILIGSLLISAIVATIPFIEYNFGVFSAFRSYVLNYGAELFLWLSVTAVAAIVATIVLYRANFSVLATATFLVAALTFVSMCLPAQARSLQKYYSHEGRQTRLVEKFNVEISSDGRFQNIELSYWYGRGEDVTSKAQFSPKRTWLYLDPLSQLRLDFLSTPMLKLLAMAVSKTRQITMC